MELRVQAGSSIPSRIWLQPLLGCVLQDTGPQILEESALPVSLGNAAPGLSPVLPLSACCRLSTQVALKRVTAFHPHANLPVVL